jgi:uncharacterized protein (TIGR02611 family)
MMKRVVHHAKRVIRVTAGIVIVITGLIMSIPGVPGPGLLVAFAGLSILAIDFVWAHRLKTKLQDQAGKVVNRVRGRKKEDDQP